MTVSSSTNKVSYDGDGATTSFAIPFYFIADNDIQVVLRGTDGSETTWVDGTQYSLTGAGNEAGGTLTVDTSPTDYTPASGTKLVITRQEQYTQPTDLPSGGVFPSSAVEQIGDRGVMMAQQLKELLDRVPRVPISDDVSGSDLELPIDDDRASKLLGFDANGKITVYATSEGGGAAAENVTATGSTTAISQADRWARVFEPEDFGAEGDGATDDTTAVQAMLDAVPDGGVCRLRLVYLISSILSVQDKSITILGPGTLYRAFDGSDVLYLAANEEAAIAISSIDNADSYDYSEGDGNSTTVASLTFASAPDIEAGDIIKVYSDDSIEGDNSANLIGEFARVGYVDGTTVYLMAPLRETYTTTPKCLVINKDIKFVVDGLRFDSDFTTGVADDWTGTYLQVRGAFQPEIRNVRCVNGYSVGIDLFGCVEAKVLNPVIFNFRRVPDNTIPVPGYGIQDSASEGTQVDGPIGALVRHIYTTNAFSTPNTGLKYGRTFGAVISNGMGFACSASAFDVHSDAQNITFIGCRTFGSFKGQSSGGNGYQLRGRHNRCIGCSDHGSAIGFVFATAYANDGLRCQIVNCAAYGNTDAAIRLDPAAATTLSGIEIRRFYAEPADTCTRGIRLDDSTAYCEDIRLRWNPSVAGTAAFAVETDSTLKARGVRIDWTGATTGTLRAVSYEGTGNNVEIENVNVDVGSANWQAFWRGANDASDVIYFKDVNTDKAPTIAAGVTNVHASAVYAGEYRVADGRTANTNVFTQTVSAASQTVDPSKKIGQHLICVVTADNAASAITEIEDGVFDGQMLTIVSAAASTQDLDITAGNQIDLSGSITLSAKQAQGFVWNLAAGKWLAAGGEGADLVEDPDTLKADTSDNLTVGFTTDLETISFAANITPDITAEAIKELAVTGNWQLDCPSNSVAGSFAIRATNDGSARTLSLGTNVHNIGSGSYDTTAAAVNIICGLFYPGGTDKLYVTIGQPS